MDNGLLGGVTRGAVLGARTRPMDKPAFSTRALHYLESLGRLKDDLPERVTLCSNKGGLLHEMEQFVRSLGRQFKHERNRLITPFPTHSDCST